MQTVNEYESFKCLNLNTFDCVLGPQLTVDRAERSRGKNSIDRSLFFFLVRFWLCTISAKCTDACDSFARIWTPSTVFDKSNSFDALKKSTSVWNPNDLYGMTKPSISRKSRQSCFSIIPFCVAFNRPRSVFTTVAWSIVWRYNWMCGFTVYLYFIKNNTVAS